MALYIRSIVSLLVLTVIPIGCEQEVWTDPNTELAWQVVPGGKHTWNSAIDYCENLELQGDNWRLPTFYELCSLIRGCEYPTPTLHCVIDEKGTDAYWKNSCYSGCQSTMTSGPADGCFWPYKLEGACGHYWSSTELGDAVQTIDVHSGNLFQPLKTQSYNVHCIRSE